MDPAAAFLAINWLAVLAASVSAFVVGGLWYGPIFGKAWSNVTGITDEMLGVFYLFEGRPLKHFFINASYATTALTLMGAILGAFN